MAINALLLLDGVSSHSHQSWGLVRELARHTSVNTEEFFVQMHSSWMRGYLRKALTMSSPQTLDWASHCFNWQEDQYNTPDLIISAGEETKLLMRCWPSGMHATTYTLVGKRVCAVVGSTRY